MPISHPPKPLLIAVHDACPAAESALRTILENLSPLVGNRIAAAVIPLPQGAPWPPHSRTAALIQSYCGELLLHGLTHRREANGSCWSWMVRGCDEFAAMPATQAQRRLDQGIKICAELFGPTASLRGFVAPAWASGPLTLTMLAESGLTYRMGLTRIEAVASAPMPLVTWSWDCGRFSVLGWAGEAAGRCMALRPSAVPCIVLHPADVRRGFLPVALARLHRLLDLGFTPTLPRALFINESSARAAA